jgi:hypothetical protein
MIGLLENHIILKDVPSTVLPFSLPTVCSTLEWFKIEEQEKEDVR